MPGRDRPATTDERDMPPAQRVNTHGNDTGCISADGLTVTSGTRVLHVIYCRAMIHANFRARKLCEVADPTSRWTIIPRTDGGATLIK